MSELEAQETTPSFKRVELGLNAAEENQALAEDSAPADRFIVEESKSYIAKQRAKEALGIAGKILCGIAYAFLFVGKILLAIARFILHAIAWLVLFILALAR